MARRIAQWRAAWVGLALALGLHVTDEALTGFLPVYNQAVEGVPRQVSVGSPAASLGCVVTVEQADVRAREDHA